MRVMIGVGAVLVTGAGAQVCSPSEVNKILASDGSAGDGFGRSVSVSGDVAIVGAPNDEGGLLGLPAYGSAYIYRFNGTQWVEEMKIQPTADDGVGQFGTSVAIDGEIAVVGSTLDSTTVTGSGSAYIYRYDGGSWTLDEQIFASDIAVNDEFGFAVAISGETVVIGSPKDDDDGQLSGGVYVFDYDDILGVWNENAKLTASDADGFDEFGYSVAIDGTRIVVGAYMDEPGGASERGSAYVFDYDGSAWNESVKLTASDGAANDRFGVSVDVDGDIIAVGANQDDASAFFGGAVYIYRNGTGGWAESKLFASDGEVLDSLGGSVAVSGDSVLAGAEFEGDNGAGAGAAYLFRYNGSSWIEDSKILASDGDVNDHFGRSVALSGDTMIIGAEFEGENGNLAGAAYGFDLGCGGPCIADITGDGSLDIFDVFAYLDLFNAGDLAADITGDGSLDIFDVFAFLDAFNGGCP